MFGAARLRKSFRFQSQEINFRPFQAPAIAVCLPIHIIRREGFFHVFNWLNFGKKKRKSIYMGIEKST